MFFLVKCLTVSHKSSLCFFMHARLHDEGVNGKFNRKWSCFQKIEFSFRHEKKEESQLMWETVAWPGSQRYVRTGTHLDYWWTLLTWLEDKFWKWWNRVEKTSTYSCALFRTVNWARDYVKLIIMNYLESKINNLLINQIIIVIIISYFPFVIISLF